MGAVVEAIVDHDAIERALTAIAGAGASELELLDDEQPPVIAARFDAFDEKTAEAAVRRALEGIAVELSTRPLSQAESSELWALKTIHAGGLSIVPAGRPASPDALRISSGLSFGTGHHPTTQLCLDRIVELSPIHTLLDVGTGSGILGLAALKLGATQVFATEKDRAALALAKKNAEENGLSEHFFATLKAPAELGAKFSVVVANIIASSLLDLAPELVRCLDSDGVLLLSGVRESEVLEVSKTYVACGLEHPVITEREGWSMLELHARW